MLRKLRVLLGLAVGLLPAARAKNHLLNVLGHDVHPSARIAPVLLIGVRRLRVGQGTKIGYGNVLRGLALAEFGAENLIGARNDIRANPGFRAVADEPELVGVFRTGDRVFISRRHVFDCSGGVVLGDKSGLAGRDVFVYSHSYDPELDIVTCAPTRIGTNSMVASKTTLAMGATLPDRCILALGAVLLPGATRTDALYGGVPAKPLDIDIRHWKAFTRTQLTAGKQSRAAALQRAEPA